MNIGVFAIILDNTNNVLMGARKDGVGRYPPGVLELPGGTLDQDESLLDGLRREVVEETGIQLDPEGLCPFAHFRNRNGESHYYVYHLTPGEQEHMHPQNYDDNEHKWFRWVGIDDELGSLGRDGALALHRDVITLWKNAPDGVRYNLGIDGDLVADQNGISPEDSTRKDPLFDIRYT